MEEQRQASSFNNRWKEKMAEVREQMQNGRLKGEVQALKRGFGFIRHKPPNDNRKDFFFHRSELDGISFVRLEKGDLVSFEPVEDGEKGFKAVNVVLECEEHLK